MTFPCLGVPSDSREPDMPLDAEICAVGLMSGTSLDGVDAAVLTTDGVSVIRPGPALTLPYSDAFKADLRALLGLDRTTGRQRASDAEIALTQIHARAVKAVLREMGERDAAEAEKERAATLIGFHGHTLTHAPERGWTWQLGDGECLARTTGLDVICDFRSADIAAGGQGAPLAPLYHRAICAGQDKPMAVLNVGGVANVTWIGPEDNFMAFDTGPGNALIDDWMQRHGLGSYDAGGALAAQGRVDEAALNAWLDDDYFRQPPPKSLDRLSFSGPALDGLSALSVADGAATLTALTARSVALSRENFPQSPRRWIITGGGRHNHHLMADLRECLGAPVESIESLGWSGDALEAQAFAYLAVRALKGLPLTDPATTGAARPLSGGRLCRAG